jgi:hypothetical protein
MDTISPQREEAIRGMLIGYVGDHPARRRPRRWSFTLVITGVVLAAGVSTGAFAAGTLLAPGPQQPVGQPIPDLGAPIAAPAGVIPGSPVSALVGDPFTIPYDREATVSLADRPSEATHARVSVHPIKTAGEGGTLKYGTDAAGNNPSLTWTASDVAGTDPEGWYDFPVDATVSTLYITSTGAGTVTIQYITQVPTEFGVNANGESYGITGSDRGEPDLIAVEATNGSQGYVYRTELEEANGTAAIEDFDSPEDALAWQEAHAGVVHLIAVYNSDGTTEIGEFRAGG